ncbi:DUF4834 family protein [Rapidithrix thailandica]|uniref:DUF4834 family protein n=1 Tax=Rapidithrix thailandica TaxID=413964 RepID=A0AAW9SBJ3_9BACT
MTALIKFLIIAIVIIYIISRFAGYFLRVAYWFMGKQIQKEVKKEQERRQGKRSWSQGDLKITVSNKNEKKQRKSYNGGEYVDFEEVKGKSD